MNIPLTDGCEVILYKKWLTKKECLDYIKLCQDVQYVGGKTSFGKGEVPRLQKYFNNDNRYFSEVWKQRFLRWQPNKYPDWLEKLQTKINKEVNIEYNSSLINFYRNGNDTMRPHKDDQPSWGNEPVISSLSLGESRQFLFEPVLFDETNPRSMKSNKDKHPVEITLDSGDLLVMKGKTQIYYKHSVPKSETNKPRWNITFRKVL